MKGLMGQLPLTVGVIFERMRTVYADGEVVSYGAGDSVERTTYGEIADRVLRLVTVLRDLGVQPGDRVATFANNSARHLELYFAVPLLGAVLHTVNIRLHDEQIRYVLTHAGDELVFCDDDLLDRLVTDGTPVRRVLTMSEASALVETAVPATELPELDEETACGMCHTSGTTGMPKAVLYSHRSTFLHAMSNCMVDHLAISERDRVLPVVPMFHACGWGLPYTAPLTGAELVFAGADVSPDRLGRIIQDERVTMTAGVPTIWTQLLPSLEAGTYDASSLRLIGIGGSATPPRLLEAYDALGIEILQIWGMTETGPVACASRPRRRHRDLDAEGLRRIRAKTGTIFAGLEARVVAPDGSLVPWDGETVGELECRGPWVASAYYEDPDPGAKFSPDGWLRTGDMARMEPDGYFTIVDRSKDLVKSGGEWISSVELEGAVMSHPLVREAAVVACRSERWDERPVVMVSLSGTEAPTLEDLHRHLEGRVAKWWFPDDVVVVDEIPKTSVGKFDKKVIRSQLADTVLP